MRLARFAFARVEESRRQTPHGSQKILSKEYFALDVRGIGLGAELIDRRVAHISARTEFDEFAQKVHRSERGILDAVSILKNQGGGAAMIAVLSTLPLKQMVLIVYCILSTIFLATTVNAGSYVVATTATLRISPDAEPHRVHRTFWCVAQCVLALGLLSMGGLGVAKMFGNFSGALMVLPVLLLVGCWFRILSRQGVYLLRHHVPSLEDAAAPAEGKSARIGS